MKTSYIILLCLMMCGVANAGIHGRSKMKPAEDMREDRLGVAPNSSEGRAIEKIIDADIKERDCKVDAHEREQRSKPYIEDMAEKSAYWSVYADTVSGNDITDAHEREQRSKPYAERVAHIGVLQELSALKPSAELYILPSVVTSSGGIVYLQSFIDSGGLCRFRGQHEWEDAHHEKLCEGDVFSFGWICKICGKCRQKVKVTKEEMEWEP